MHVPAHFRLPEQYVTAMLGRVRMGNLVTVHGDGPASTMAPFYLDAERETLVTHLVRVNPQVREDVVGPALVIFDEADAYVSPRWYATNDVTPSVPTWDYLTLHVRGSLTVSSDPVRALEVVRELTSRMGEAPVLDAVGEERMTAMSRAIVAVEVALDEVTGKAKMSQNRHPDDIRSLAAELERQGQAVMADYLRDVSLPYAEQRFATITRLRREREARVRLGTGKR